MACANILTSANSAFLHRENKKPFCSNGTLDLVFVDYDYMDWWSSLRLFLISCCPRLLSFPLLSHRYKHLLVWQSSQTLPLKAGSIGSLLPLLPSTLPPPPQQQTSKETGRGEAKVLRAERVCQPADLPSRRGGMKREGWGSRERSDYWCSSNLRCVSLCCEEPSSGTNKSSSSSSSVRHVSLSRAPATQKGSMGELSD